MKRILILFFMLWSLVSCEKYLETAPDQRTVLDSPEKISELLTSAYPQASYFAFAEAMSDNVADKGQGSLVFFNYDPWTFSDMRYRDQDSPDFYWYACYKAISVANRALTYIAGVSDPENYQSQKGEALVARAYAHFMLVTFFAKVYNEKSANTDPGIPYVTEPEEELLVKYQRKTVAYVYEQIENDLLEGLPLLDDSRYKAPKYHFTKTATHAFASRFYLFKKNYAESLKHANQVFGEADITSYLRPVNSSNYRAMEYFTKQAEYTKASNPSNILLVEAATGWGSSFASVRYGLNSDLMMSLFFSNTVTGGSYAYSIYGTEFSYNIPKFKTHFVRTGLNANYGIAYNMIPILSAEEVFLNRIEAKAMLGQYNSAIEDLNTYASQKFFISQNQPSYTADLEITVAKLFSFYGLSDLKSNLMQAVLDFKRREYVFEGMRYLDILRHDIPVLHTSKDGKDSYFLGPNDLRRTLQLPQEVTMAGIEPNPR